jgi:antitoxin component of RelBE/YafQ-DinJ toxin-antitoxin module
MMSQDVQVTINVDRELKENADALLGYLGLNMSNPVVLVLPDLTAPAKVPLQKVYRIMGLLPQIINVCNKILIYDNSIMPHLLFKKMRMKLHIFPLILSCKFGKFVFLRIFWQILIPP